MIFLGFVEDILVFGKKFAIVKLRTLAESTSVKQKKVQFITKDENKIKILKEKVNREAYVNIIATKKDFNFKPEKDTIEESYELQDLHLCNNGIEQPDVSLQKPGVELNESEVIKRHKKHQEKILIRHEFYNFLHKFLGAKTIYFECPKLINGSSEGGSQILEIEKYNQNTKLKLKLSQSPQLYKQMMINRGFKAVYSIGSIYRNENFNTSKHLSEATCLDYEGATTELKPLFNLLSNLIIASSVHLNSIWDYIPVYDHNDFDYIDYKEALKLLSLSEDSILTHEQESLLVKRLNCKFLFITGYPNATRPFYTKEDTGFDLITENVELASGSLRICNYYQLLNSLKNNNIPSDTLSFYLESFKKGCPESGGFGFGVDRYLMTILNCKNIKEVKYFDYY